MNNRKQQTYEFGRFRLNAAEQSLERDGEALSLTPKVFDTLKILVENHGHLVEKDEILEKVWSDTVVEEANLAKNISVLRKILSENGLETPVIETVPKRGYRFVAPVRDLGIEQSGAVESLQIEPSDRSDDASQNKRIGLKALVVVSIITTVMFGYWYFARAGNRIDTIAVMPFVNDGGNKDLEYLSDGLTETLIGRLTRLPKLSVKARSTVFYYKERELSPSDIGNELGVEVVLLGRVVQRGDNLKISLELVDTESGNALWAETYDRKMGDLIEIEGEIAKDVSDALRIELSRNDEKVLRETHITDPNAYRFYLRGTYHLNKLTSEDHVKAIGFFRRAVELDPNSALAWTGLAHAYVWAPKDEIAEHISLARAAVRKASGLAPDLPLTRVVQANILYIEDWDLIGAEREYKSAIRMDPKGANLVHLGYGWVLASRLKVADGLEQMQIALQIEPLNLLANRDFGEFLYLNREFQRASDHYRDALGSFPEDSELHRLYAKSLSYLGRYNDALSECKKSIQLSKLANPTKLCLAEVHAKSGDKVEAYKILAQDKNERPAAAMSWRVERDSSLLWRAEIYSLLSDKKNALNTLTKLGKEMEKRNVRNRWYEDAQMRLSPNFDGLRDERRFVDLTGKIGFPNKLVPGDPQ